MDVQRGSGASAMGVLHGMDFRNQVGYYSTLAAVQK